MRILYGVQGTGNGHITRARAMARALAQTSAQVDWVFSGRPAEQYFDMEVFGDYRTLTGLTFAVRQGRIDALATLRGAALVQLWRDIHALDLSGYDVIVSDYEPVVAWAARRSGRECIGIGHQYAFHHDIHKAGHNRLSEAVMRWFAPVSLGLGVHWHHYQSNILPPIIEPDAEPDQGARDTVLVYLPFEDETEVMRLLQRFDRWRFIVHSARLPPGRQGNVEVKGFSRAGFRQSIHQASRVICNAGFELASESLSLGKALLVKPVHGQMEQTSNALALSELGLGRSMKTLDRDIVAGFLEDSSRVKVRYPDVASSLGQWLISEPREPVETLVQRLWQGVATETLAANEPTQKAFPA
ncbi:MAG: MJ1255/VC2487 family glycosyltransferase [Saccharospirillum sp.]